MQLAKGKKKRIPQYDLMRVIAIFLVVYVHSSHSFNFTPGIDSKQAGLYWFTGMLALVCNPLFFMVSGKFNLSQAAKMDSSGYRTFYIKKVVDLLLPIVFYAIAFWILKFVGIKLFGAWNDGTSFWNAGAFFENIHLLLITSWWFVPMIFSLMIFTPFLGHMLSNLKNKEMYVLIGVIFGCAAIIAIEKLLGFTTVLSKFFAPVLLSWAGIYIFGFVIDKVKMTSRVLIGWYVAAGITVVVFGSIFVFSSQNVLLPLPESGSSVAWNGMLNAIFYPIVAGALFLFFKGIKINGERVKKAVEFVGNRAFGIYLIHFCFLFSFLQILPEQLRGSDGAVYGITKRVIITILVYLASLAVATVVDLLIVNPIQKRLKAKLLKTA